MTFQISTADDIKTKLETEVTNMIAKYDVDITTKQTEMDELNAVYDEELAQLKTLTAFFDKVDADKANENAEETKSISQLRGRTSRAFVNENLAMDKKQKPQTGDPKRHRNETIATQHQLH